MQIVEWLRRSYVLWRPQSSQVRRRLKALRAMPALAYIQRATNGQADALWRSFHFDVVGTPWRVIVHDQESDREPWAIFINTSKSYSFQGRFADFPKFVAQLPESLQQEFMAHEALFPSAGSVQAADAP